MLELAVLGLLKDRPMHGYQLSRELGDQLGGAWRVSYGSLYPTLRRLERSGAVVPVADDGAVTRGRRRTTYRITEEGERLFFQLLQEAPHDNQTEDQRFRVRLAFFRYLTPEMRLRLLARGRAALEERLATIKDSMRATREHADDYTLALMQHGRATTESDIEWVDGLIRAERTRTEQPARSKRRGSATLRRKEHTS